MDISRMISTIQIYIHHKKDVEVNITPILPRDFLKLMTAHTIASNWVQNNLIKSNK